MTTLRRYSMRDASAIANRAAAAVERKLRSQPATVDVVNVEDDAAYQVKDIDILWLRRLEDGSIKTIKIEVKGDRHYNTGNYFLETISNEGKGTPGCFMYTEADFVYYYFVDERELHILPMPATRDWFRKHLSEFKERKTSTPVDNGEHYVTVGRLVPRHVVLANVPGVKILKI